MSEQKKSPQTLVTERFALDALQTSRSMDENGFMHVGLSNITKATINPYYGAEVAGWEELGLDPDKIYMAYRAPDELQKSLDTWSGLPLQFEHHMDNADEPAKLTRVGSVGTQIVWADPYVQAPLTIWDTTAIQAIEDGSCKELSCAYYYEPDFTPGEVNGEPYDFVMRSIRGNHVALVPKGRAGRDVYVADADSKKKTGGKFMSKLRQFFKKRAARDGDPAVEQAEVDLAQAIIDLHKLNPVTGEIVDITEDEEKLDAFKKVVDSLSEKLSEDDIKALCDSLGELVFVKPEQDEEPEGLDEEIVEAMKDLHLDSDDPALAAAFVEGVEFGQKADAIDFVEDENELVKVMDECGLDTEDPKVQEAFAEGVKYGEKLEKSEPEHLDHLHESEGTKRADDEEEKAATDHALRKRFSRARSAVRKGVAMDVDAIRRNVTREVRREFTNLYKAAETVRPIVGNISAHAFDSAEAIYAYALKACNYNPRNYPRSTWGAVVKTILEERAAKDAIPVPTTRTAFTGPFAALKQTILS